MRRKSSLLRPRSPEALYLVERLKAHSNKYAWAAVTIPTPPSVRRARKIAKRFDRLVARTTNQARADFQRARVKAEEAILFGDAKAGLKAVRKFEALTIR